MKLSNGISVFTAVAYADVFDYPLTLEELRYWSVGRIPLGKLQRHTVPALSFVTFRGQTYAVLKGRARLVERRAERAHIAKKKWDIAKAAFKFLSFIPTVQLIGITGGLAVDNVTTHDDIDVFIIAKQGTLWITRLMVTLITDLLRIRRHPQDLVVTDKVCLNMFMDEGALTLLKKDRDLFAAHEVLQMKPVLDRGGTYKKFLLANRWAEKYLPHAWREQEKVLRISYYGKNKQETTSLIRTTCTLILRAFEPLARRAQIRYMQQRRTTEVITGSIIRFHPVDARVYVKEQLAQRLRQYNIPLDKIFYDR